MIPPTPTGTSSAPAARSPFTTAGTTSRCDPVSTENPEG